MTEIRCMLSTNFKIVRNSEFTPNQNFLDDFFFTIKLMLATEIEMFNSKNYMIQPKDLITGVIQGTG